MTRAHARAALVVLASLLGGSTATAQWAVSIGIRAPRFSGGAVTPGSPFTHNDLDPSLEPRALWRREVGASLRYRL